LATGERIDVDRATVGDLTRLPRVGPSLAKTIVADRESHGPFGGLEGLDRVPGIGPGLLKALETHVSFSGAARQMGGPAAQKAPVPLNLNSATLVDLDALPGIGPAKAAAILRYREEHGPFTAVEDLARVPGFGVGWVAKLRDRVSAP
jgi:competence protein ComEA